MISIRYKGELRRYFKDTDYEMLPRENPKEEIKVQVVMDEKDFDPDVPLSNTIFVFKSKSIKDRITRKYPDIKFYLPLSLMKERISRFKAQVNEYSLQIGSNVIKRKLEEERRRRIYERVSEIVQGKRKENISKEETREMTPEEIFEFYSKKPREAWEFFNWLVLQENLAKSNEESPVPVGAVKEEENISPSTKIKKESLVKKIMDMDIEEEEREIDDSKISIIGKRAAWIGLTLAFIFAKERDKKVMIYDPRDTISIIGLPVGRISERVFRYTELPKNQNFDIIIAVNTEMKEGRLIKIKSVNKGVVEIEEGNRVYIFRGIPAIPSYPEEIYDRHGDEFKVLVR